MDAMKRSIERDGFLVPILVRPMKGKSKSNGTAQQYEIVSGNHRAMAAKEVGMTHVPAVIGRLNERQSRRVAVNLNTIHGEPNAELMAPFLAELDDALLATIHLDDSMRRQVLAFDETLASRLAQLQPPDSLNNPSTGNIPDCLCPTCGRRHQTKTKDEKSAKA